MKKFQKFIFIFLFLALSIVNPFIVYGYEWIGGQNLEKQKIGWNCTVVDYDRIMLMPINIVSKKFYCRIDQNYNNFVIGIYQLKTGQDFESVSGHFSEPGVCNYLGKITHLDYRELKSGKYILKIVAPRGNTKTTKDMRIIFGPPQK